MSNLNKELLYQIKAEITKTDYADYVKEGRHYDLANKFNDTLIIIDEPVSIAELNSFADTYGLLLVLEDVMDAPKDTYTADVIKAVRQILRVFTARYDTVDLTLPAVGWAFGQLAQANIFTQDIIDMIFALGKKRIPLSIYMFGVLLTSNDVAAALQLL